MKSAAACKYAVLLRFGEVVQNYTASSEQRGTALRSRVSRNTVISESSGPRLQRKVAIASRILGAKKKVWIFGQPWKTAFQ